VRAARHGTSDAFSYVIIQYSSLKLLLVFADPTHFIKIMNVVMIPTYYFYHYLRKGKDAFQVMRRRSLGDVSVVMLPGIPLLSAGILKPRAPDCHYQRQT